MDRKEIERLQKILEEARREAEEAKREAERAHQEHLRFMKENEKRFKEIEEDNKWWDSVKSLPLEERKRQIFKHYNHKEEERLQEGVILNYFPLGEA